VLKTGREMCRGTGTTLIFDAMSLAVPLAVPLVMSNLASLTSFNHAVGRRRTLSIAL
jgi:hypothetical protein